MPDGLSPAEYRQRVEAAKVSAERRRRRPRVTLLVGPPGSGKTTWRSQNQGSAVVISTDDDIDAYAREKGLTYDQAFMQVDHGRLTRRALERFDAAIGERRDVIVDRTNMRRSSRARFLERVPPAYERHAVVFDVPRQELFRRLEDRQQKTGKAVPYGVVAGMLATHEPVQPDEVDVLRAPRKGYTGWKVPQKSRDRLTRAVPPAYERFIGHHVTDEYNVTEGRPQPRFVRHNVIGVADDGEGLQALVLEAVDALGNRSTRRADGKPYHVTWSLAPGRRPSEASAVIEAGKWRRFDRPVSFMGIPEFFPFQGELAKRAPGSPLTQAEHRQRVEAARSSAAKRRGSDLESYARAVPVLSQHDEIALGRRARVGDEAARNRLVESHLRLVLKPARDFAWNFPDPGTAIHDLQAAGVEGLLDATKTFDPDRGVRFGTLARRHIEGKIKAHMLRNRGASRVVTTAEDKRLFFNLDREKARLGVHGSLESDPKLLLEVAHRLKAKPTAVLAMERRLYARDISLQEVLGEGEDAEEGQDYILSSHADRDQGAETHLIGGQDERLRSSALQRAMAALPERERRIVVERHLKERGKTLRDLSGELGVSVERVRQLEAQALRRLRVAMPVEKLAKREVGKPLTDAEREQRRNAALARWGAVGGGAALGAGVGAGIGLGAAYDHAATLRDGHRTQAATATKQLHAVIDDEAARAPRWAALAAGREKRIAGWPVPEWKRELRRQIAIAEVKGVSADDLKAELADLEAKAKKPFKRERAGATVSEAGPFVRRGPKGKAAETYDLFGKPENKARFDADHAEWMKWADGEIANGADINEVMQSEPNPKHYRLKAGKSRGRKKVEVSGRKAHTRAPTKARYQGFPDDAGLRDIRRKYREKQATIVGRAKAIEEGRAKRLVDGIKHPGLKSAKAVREAFAAIPKAWRTPAALGAIAGAGLGYGTYELFRSDQGELAKSAPQEAPDMGRGGGGQSWWQQLATSLARALRLWRDEPDKTDPTHLVEATEAARLAFLDGAAKQDAVPLEDRAKILGFAFGPRNPDIERAARDHQLKLVGALSETQAASIKQALVDHAVRGQPIEQTARSIKEAIGLTPTQAKHVAAYRLELENLHPGAMNRALRDRRYDRTVQKALDEKKPLEPGRIDKMVEAYQRRYIAYRATTIARTEALRASNQGSIETVRRQLEAMPDMTVVKTWIATKDDKTRPSHRALDGKSVVGLETAFVTTDGVPIRWPHDDLAPASECVSCRCSFGLKVIPQAKAATSLMAEAV